jgi:sigma-B regulation protein RsbU (phosphoserine phosphatase)
VLDAGEGVVLYTDGVVEAVNARNEQYGDSRLLEVLARDTPNPEALVQTITEDVRGFSAGRAQSDDLTIVCFDRLGI